MRLRFVEGLQNPSTSSVVTIVVAVLTRVVNDAVGVFFSFYLFCRVFLHVGCNLPVL